MTETETELAPTIPNMSWLQTKVAAQREALHILNHRVVVQRAVLRRLTELGHTLEDEDWKIVRAEVERLDPKIDVDKALVG